jgi:hypothetical protein
MIIVAVEYAGGMIDYAHIHIHIYIYTYIYISQRVVISVFVISSSEL